MKVARWGKEVAEGMDSRLTGGGREELAKGREGRKGWRKKVKLIFVRAWAPSLSLSLFLYPSFFSPPPSFFPSSGSVRKVSPAYLARKLLGIRGTLIPQIDDFTKWYEAVWENGESHGKKDKLGQQDVARSPFFSRPCWRSNYFPETREDISVLFELWQTFVRDQKFKLSQFLLSRIMLFFLFFFFFGLVV